MAAASKLHVVLFPFMAQGHIIPSLALATTLISHRYCHKITIVNTPLNIRRIRRSLPPETISAVHLAELPFSPADHGLPRDTENTDTLPTRLFPNLFLAAESLKPSFERLVADIIAGSDHHNRPICIIADVFLGWTVEIAEKLGVFHAVLVTSGAFGSAVFFSLLLNNKHHRSTLESKEVVSLVESPEVRLHREHVTNTIIPGDGSDPMTEYIGRQIRLCFRSGGLLVNTVEELERTGVKMLRKLSGGRNIPIWPVGPLLRHPSAADAAFRGGVDGCMKWIGSHPPASVVYVSFGSQNSIPAEQMMELAKGLEEAGKPFVWVIRPPAGFDGGDEEFRPEGLPEGFERRVRERNQGVLVRRWAPQLEILSRVATGAFLSHCGWNSVVESLSCGVPLIGWPLVADQLFNAKMLAEEIGVCVEVARGRYDYRCSGGDGEVREKVARAIGVVMGNTEEGREMRRKAKEIKEMFCGAVAREEGSSVQAMADFLRAAVSMGSDN